MKKFVLFSVLIVSLVSLVLFAQKASAHGVGDSCGQQFTYEKSSDYDDSRVHFEYEEDEHGSNYKRRISLTAGTGYKIVDIWLEIDGINVSGWDLHFTSALNDYNPNPGGEIENAKAVVEKVCATPTPTATATATPIATPTLTPTPEVTPTQDPCIEQGTCETPLPTPTPEATASPEPTAQPTTPSCGSEEHLDLSGTKCLKYELGGPQAPSGGATGGQVLGASTMAKTGVAEEAIFNLIFVLGSGLTALGLRKFRSTI